MPQCTRTAIENALLFTFTYQRIQAVLTSSAGGKSQCRFDSLLFYFHLFLSIQIAIFCFV